jgi:hypothetical protein
MSTTETGNAGNVDSKIAHVYDEAIARAQVDPNDANGTHASRAEVQGQLDVTAPNPDDLQAEGADPATSPATAESKLGPGEEIRDREFPVPPEMTGSGSGKLLVDQDTMSDDESRRGGRIGTQEGDIQRASDVPSIIDQDAVEPDLGQELR